MRIGELLGALSLATDLAAGLPLETSLRTCVLATRIATSLGIAVRTANHHVENIYAKLDVTTRAAAAVFAVRHDLVSPDP